MFFLYSVIGIVSSYFVFWKAKGGEAFVLWPLDIPTFSSSYEFWNMGELEQPCDEKKFDIFYDILHLIVLK